MNKKILTVYPDKQNATVGVIVTLAMAIFTLFLAKFFFHRNALVPHAGLLIYFVFIVLQVLLCVVALLFLVSALYYYFFANTSEPVLIVSEQGVWVRNYNFLEWKDIDFVTKYSVVDAVECIGLNVKDRAKLFNQSTISGKISLLWVNVFNNYHITLTGLDTENEIIIDCLKKYLT